jgi:hypothetical protein
MLEPPETHDDLPRLPDRMRIAPSLRRAASIAVLTLLPVGCDTPTPPGPGQQNDVLLAIHGGHAQGGLPGELLQEPMVVRVTRGGEPLAGVIVEFAASGGSLVGGSSQLTDGQGLASVVWIAPAGAAFDQARLVARRAAAPADSVVFTIRRSTPSELHLVINDHPAPVRMVVFRQGFFSAGQVTRSFADSAHLQPFPGSPPVSVAAFTPGRVPLLLSHAWGTARDTLRVAFRAPEEVVPLALTVWVVEPPFDSTLVLVQQHLQKVREIWEEQAQIGLGQVRIVDATAFPGADQFQGSGFLACTNDKWTVIGWDEGNINVYYTGQAQMGGVIGAAVYCGTAFIEIFPLAWQRSGNTLAHEIGHGFLGGHHETDPANLMYHADGGTALTEGQLFRAHFSDQSLLNTLFSAHPTELRRPCVTQPAACPPTTYRIPD